MTSEDMSAPDEYDRLPSPLASIARIAIAREIPIPSAKTLEVMEIMLDDYLEEALQVLSHEKNRICANCDKFIPDYPQESMWLVGQLVKSYDNQGPIDVWPSGACEYNPANLKVKIDTCPIFRPLKLRSRQKRAQAYRERERNKS